MSTGDPQEQVPVTHEGGPMRCSRCHTLVEDRFTATGIFVKSGHLQAVWCVCDACVQVVADRLMQAVDGMNRSRAPIVFFAYGPAYVLGVTGREWYEYEVKESER